MLTTALLSAALVYGLGALYSYFWSDLSRTAYPSPAKAAAEVDSLATEYPGLCRREVIGCSSEGRPIVALRLRPPGACEANRPTLLVTAQIHAIEFVGSYVARAVAVRLLRGYGSVPVITQLLDAADVWLVPLLNPDGAERVWAQGGWTTLGGSRFTANGVDPNRNFPFIDSGQPKAWNSARTRRGSPYYRGPQPLSEPECMALAKLCARAQFSAALHFHSFSGVVFMPRLLSDAAAWRSAATAARALNVMRTVFPSHQPHLRYRPVPEPFSAIEGQLDPFLLNAFGTPSVTIEVSRPRWELLHPTRLLRPFCWANPTDPAYWATNDVDATVFALAALHDATKGTPVLAPHPEMWSAIE